jgi:hypothetical protein
MDLLLLLLPSKRVSIYFDFDFEEYSNDEV